MNRSRCGALLQASGKKENVMRAEILCFTEHGKETALKAAEGLEKFGIVCSFWLKSKYALAEEPFSPVKESLRDWTAERWQSEILVFVGATGIAVRAIAPFVKSKTTDPAVIVLDEKGQFCIPLLSGHIGGANAFAAAITDSTGSIPVVTTATDINSLFAVDVFAKNNALQIDNMKLAKEVSAALLCGIRVGIYSELPLEGELPKGLVLCENQAEAKERELSLGIYIGYHTKGEIFSRELRLIPGIIAVGMGCRRDTPPEPVRELFAQVMKEEKLEPRAVNCLASIDIKKDEPGLKALAEELKVPFLTYSAQELQAAEGDFTPSSFVSSITGVDNVCERSAVLASGNGRLIRKKTPLNKVTAAVAAGKRRIYFE